MTPALFWICSVVAAFTVSLLLGGLIARYIFGCDLNEEEYYDKSVSDRRKRF